MKAFLQNAKNKRGQALVEYALILALISIVSISVLTAFGANLAHLYSTINSQLANAIAVAVHG